MNTQEPTELPPLPELSDSRIDEIEEALFAGIARERVIQQGETRRLADRRARRRRTVWWSTAAAAVVVVSAVAVGPVLGGLGITGVSGGSTAVDESAPDLGGAVPQEGTDGGAGFVDGRTDPDAAAGSSMAERDIIATAQATVRVDDVAPSAQAIGAAAEKRGGYVESMNIGKDGPVVSPDRVQNGGDIAYPAAMGTWITVRVPADQLTGAMDELSALGTVESSSITRQDVTEQAIDLRARVDSLEASVARLTELMSKAGSVGDLIAAESALSERQAELESYQQQLTSLEDQVALSSLTVSLVEKTERIEADPAGFGDGLVAGWNGLVATLNGLVIGVGFLLPWIAVAAVVALVVWGIIALVRRRRARTAATPGSADADADDAP
jgi:hypothetical protein